MTMQTMLSIKSVRSADKSEWDEIWQKCDYSTYYHSREWAEVLSVFTKNQLIPQPKIVVFSDGKKALIPLLLEKKMWGLIKNYFSSWDGDYGGPISVDGLGDDHIALIMNYLTKDLVKRLGDLKINLPFEIIFSDKKLRCFS